METTTTTMSRVCEVLKISTDRYIEMWFDLGNDYLDNYVESTIARVSERSHRRVEHFANAFRFSIKFWFWWRFETEGVDRAFLAYGNYTVDCYLHMQQNRLSVPPQSVIEQIIDEAKGIKTKTTYNLSV